MGKFEKQIEAQSHTKNANHITYIHPKMIENKKEGLSIIARKITDE